MQQDPQNPQPTPVAPQPAAPQSVTPAPIAGGPTPKKKFPTWLIVLLSVIAGFIAIIVAIVVLVSVLAAGPRTVSDEFINNVQANNVSASYAQTSTAFKEATTEEQLASLMERTSTYLEGNETHTGSAVESKNGTNFAAITYSVAGDQTVYVRVVLIEEEGEWKVQSFRTDDEPIEATVE